MRRIFSSPRALRIALGVSVALNLAVLGVVAGVAMKHPPGGDPSRGFAFGPFTAALTPEDRRELRGAFREAAPDLRGAFGRMRAEFGQMQGILRAEPYDPAAFAALLDRQRERGDEMTRIAQRLIAEHVAAFDHDDRIAFADKLAEEAERRHRHRD